MGEVYIKYTDTVIVVRHFIWIVSHKPNFFPDLAHQLVERRNGIGEFLGKLGYLLVDIISYVGVSFAEDEGFDRVENEGAY